MNLQNTPTKWTMRYRPSNWRNILKMNHSTHITTMTMTMMTNRAYYRIDRVCFFNLYSLSTKKTLYYFDLWSRQKAHIGVSVDVSDLSVYPGGSIPHSLIVCGYWTDEICDINFRTGSDDHFELFIAAVDFSSVQLFYWNDSSEGNVRRLTVRWLV